MLFVAFRMLFVAFKTMYVRFRMMLVTLKMMFVTFGHSPSTYIYTYIYIYVHSKVYMYPYMHIHIWAHYTYVNMQMYMCKCHEPPNLCMQCKYENITNQPTTPALPTALRPIYTCVYIYIHDKCTYKFFHMHSINMYVCKNCHEPIAFDPICMWNVSLHWTVQP